MAGARQKVLGPVDKVVHSVWIAFLARGGTNGRSRIAARRLPTFVVTLCAKTVSLW